MSQEINLTEEQIVSRVKAANAKGFVNQMITGSGATAEQALNLYNKSNEKAAKLIKKAQQIRESILAEVNTKTHPEEVNNLPENLRSAAQ